MENKVVTRFAPSPTGLLHLGAYRTAIFSYLFARKNKGIFILRIEDTDKERSKKEYEENIIESLKWMNLSYDKFYRQSENVDRHKFFLEKMIKEGSAYISKEEAKDGSGVIKEIIRFKNPNIDVTFHDEIKGDITMNTTDLGDFVIAKNINEPLFHLAVVADDFDEGVTHIIRGEDHVSNTPRQILIQRAIGAPTPVYAHLPLVLGPDKLKLSKRRGALSITAYREQGFLPEAILNGVTFIGWNPGTEKEIFTHDELVEAFDISKVQKSPAVLNEEKLEWFNKEHIKKMTDQKFVNYAISYIESIDPEVIVIKNLNKEELYNYLLRFKERITKFSDIMSFIKHSIADSKSTTTINYPDFKIIDSSEITQNNQKITTVSGPTDYLLPLKNPVLNDKVKLLILKDSKSEEIIIYLENIKNFIKEYDWKKNIEKNNESKLWEYATKIGRGKVLWPLRLALSGQEKSNDPFEIMNAIGKDSTLKRIERAVELLKNTTNTINTPEKINLNTNNTKITIN